MDVKLSAAGLTEIAQWSVSVMFACSFLLKI